MPWSAFVGEVAFNPMFRTLALAGHAQEFDPYEWLPIYNTFATREWLMQNWLTLPTVHHA